MINRFTCFKNPEKPSCIDLISKNCPRRFRNSCAIETGLSDFHKLVVTVMKTKIIIYRSYKHFNNESLREELLQVKANRDNCDETFKKFPSSCNVIVNKHAPDKKSMKKDLVKGNYAKI